MQYYSSRALIARSTKNSVIFYASLPRASFSDKTAKATLKKAPLTEADQMAAIFANESTVGLMKKLMIYRMMSSNLFINHALRGMQLSYKILGRTLTNLMIN